VGGWGAAALNADRAEESPMRLRYAIGALLACACHTVTLLARGRIHQPRGNVGRRIHFADGTTGAVYRETVIERPPASRPAVLAVSFRLRWMRGKWGHALFRLESELNTILFAGFPGLVSKLWLRHDERGIYRGIYQWDGPEKAVAYAGALWWVLALVSERDSIHYAVLPGLDRDDFLADPALIDTFATAPGGWWRITTEAASYA
jgi:hypothetical protein